MFIRVLSDFVYFMLSPVPTEMGRGMEREWKERKKKVV